MKKLAIILGIAMFLGLPTTGFAQTADKPQGNGHQFSGQFPGQGRPFMNGEKKAPPGLMKKLNLSEDQAAKAKAIREQSRGKIKPIVEQIRSERHKLGEMRQQSSPQDQLTDQKEKIKSLVDQAKSIHKQNLQSFETILTPEQKTQFEEIKKQRMEGIKKRKMQRFGEKKNSMQNQ